MKPFDKIYWHDGQIVEFNVITPSKRKGAKISLLLELYAHDQAEYRDHYEVVFEGVIKFTATADMSSLKENFSAGNIFSVVDYQNDSSIYRFYLMEGYIEIESKKVKIKKQKSGN
ncbi:MAG: hypothetical protein KA099_03785 [Alphaproteobacteria bacterium]|nr:hypothetical protein [Alphaproteobacteria bacterium]MBP7759664.1 hypothetical protein [Alphaproteobacteria bacterium]MBP7763014.1 hypothetical protein [Alphaproteobacteria bacterium]MBP7904427.1 hypothetical protein [Alphaproteobacteria bacterium]